jgi:hypothetical protein
MKIATDTPARKAPSLTDAHPIPLSQDAALVVALAGTAVPFAHSAEDEAERWLRALRLHGEVGRVMQALGVGEAPLTEDAGGPAPSRSPFGEAVLERVTRASGGYATEREADTVGTQDILRAVVEVYGELFEHVLYVRGTSAGELIEHLGDPHPARSG